MVATAGTDRNGFFCVDEIPVGHDVDVRITPGLGYETKKITGLELATEPPHTCAKKDCPNICVIAPDKCQGGCVVLKQVED